MHQKKPPFQWGILLLFPAVIFYYEVVFRLSTVSGLFRIGTLYMLLFSLCYGGVGYLLSTIFDNKKWNRICAFSYLLITALPYGIEYFIYRYFKYFFDLSTVFNGAGGVVTSFMGEIIRMVFSFSGLFRILLFLLPSILYLIFSQRLALVPRKSNLWKRVYVALAMVIIFMFSILGISYHPILGPTIGTQYNFDTVVGNFGLMTGLNLDIGYTVFDSHGSGNSFDDDVTIPNIP